MPSGRLGDDGEGVASRKLRALSGEKGLVHKILSTTPDPARAYRVNPNKRRRTTIGLPVGAIRHGKVGTLLASEARHLTADGLFSSRERCYRPPDIIPRKCRVRRGPASEETWRVAGRPALKEERSYVSGISTKKALEIIRADVKVNRKKNIAPSP